VSQKNPAISAGEPTGDAHARMKAAMVRSGRLKSAVVQPPIKPAGAAEVDIIRTALADAGLLRRQAAE
jgi:4-hydroxy-tetrahydrodipicolinate synthase